MTESKALSIQHLFRSVSISLTLGCEVGCQTIPTLTVARRGWVTLNEVSDSSLPTSVFSCFTSFPPFI